MQHDGVGDEELDGPSPAGKPFPKGSFGPGPGRAFGNGCLWGLAYLLAMTSGAASLCLWGLYLIAQDGDMGSPGGFAFVMTVLGVVGGALGLLVMCCAHVIVATARHVQRGRPGR